MLKKILSLVMLTVMFLFATNALAANYNGNANYVGNTRSKKFHVYGCSTIKHPEASHFVSFNSRDEAIAAGYVACKRCNP